MNAYDKRVRELEAEGLTTSDAQGAADAEILKAKRHTPGPWNHYKLGNNADQWGISDNTGRTIGLSYHGEANARLMATSTELLAVLKKVARLPYTLCGPTRRIELSRELEREIRAAIVNATDHN